MEYFNIRHPELWARLESHQIGGPDGHVIFAQRLAFEQGWSEQVAAKVVNEYKRFCYLAVTNPELTRSLSPAVDQVWHLHLTFTRSYWGEFCGDVLRHQLHHRPNRFGDRRFSKKNWTQCYKSTFGHRPPPTYWWPPADGPEECGRIGSIRWLDNKSLVFVPALLAIAVLVCGFVIGPLMAIIGFWDTGLVVIGIFITLASVIGLVAVNRFRSPNRHAARPAIWQRESYASLPATAQQFDDKGKYVKIASSAVGGGSGERWPNDISQNHHASDEKANEEPAALGGD